MNESNLTNEIKGRVHSIQSFGTVDGPGLRTVIFFQGCPLKCKYCHNIDMGNKNLGREYTVEELTKEVLKYKEYWISKSSEASAKPEIDIGDINSNRIKGGVTFSGGEPTFQADFVAKLAKNLKAKDVHTAIDTCFGTSKLVVEKLYPYIDYWMVSIKHLIKEDHYKLTGVFNTHILENIGHLDKKLSESSKKNLRVRFLVIPGLTDSEDHIKMLAEYLANLKSLDVAEILPYGTHGKFKWLEIYGKYELEGVPDATKEDVDKVKAVLNGYGIRTM